MYPLASFGLAAWNVNLSVGYAVAHIFRAANGLEYIVPLRQKVVIGIVLPFDLGDGVDDFESGLCVAGGKVDVERNVIAGMTQKPF